MKPNAITTAAIAEVVGTYILILFGLGAVHTAVLTGAQAGLWQVAIVWGVGLSIAIYTTAALCGAHFNPVVTITFALFGKFPANRIPAYIIAQLIGAILAAATLYALFSGIITEFESANGIVRGQPGSELTAMCYGEYFPNPAVAKAMNWTDPAKVLTTAQAMLAEVIGTAFLLFFIFAITDARNPGNVHSKQVALMIGLALAIIISVIAPLTQACLNPARDFGPRLVAYVAGWDTIAIPGPRSGFFTVYILAPTLGAPLGGLLYTVLVRHD